MGKSRLQSAVAWAAVAVFYACFFVFWHIYRDRVSLEHGLGLVGSLSSFAGTLWIMIGTLLSPDDVKALGALRNRSPKFQAVVRELFLGAQRQLLAGSLLLLLGFAAQVAGVLAAAFHW
jgi:hypothetical protein